jgi:hypothetical protein
MDKAGKNDLMKGINDVKQKGGKMPMDMKSNGGTTFKDAMNQSSDSTDESSNEDYVEMKICIDGQDTDLRFVKSKDGDGQATGDPVEQMKKMIPMIMGKITGNVWSEDTNENKNAEGQENGDNQEY